MTNRPYPVAWDGATLSLSRVAVDIQDRDIPAIASLCIPGATVGESRLQLDELRQAVQSRVDKYGFALLRHWPGDSDETKTAAAFAAFCELFGNLRAQDGNTESWRFVRDRTTADGVSGNTGSTGRMSIDLHTENARPPYPPRLISLLCIRPAAAGGRSLLASGPRLYQQLLRDHPSHAAALQEALPFGRRPEDWSDGRRFDLQPVFTDSEIFKMRYSRYWIDLAVEQSGIVLRPEVSAAIATVDQILASRGFAIEFGLETGQAVIVDNHVVMHGRSAFEDDPSEPRTLVRVWMD